MKFIEPSFEILSKDFTREKVLTTIECAARTCYKSEDKICEGSAVKLLNNLIKRGHEAMIEHAPNLSVRVITCRGVTHEIVRHRLFSFAQESTRYVTYGQNGEPMLFIIPCWIQDKDREILMEHEWNWDMWNDGRVGIPNSLSITNSAFVGQLVSAEETYGLLLKEGWKPQQAREILPNAVKTEIVITGNIREWRNFFKLRTDSAAHPQMREIMIPLLLKLNEEIPELWEDIVVSNNLKEQIAIANLAI